MNALQDFTGQSRIGYFSMEIALRSEIPTYAGGLGVLAGDTLRSAADLRIPMVAVSLVSRQGYFRQEISPMGHQVELPDPWQPGQLTTRLPAKVSVSIENREVWIGAWLYIVEGFSGGRQPVVLLDTDLAENDTADRHLTDFLYGGDSRYRLKQEIVLGIGGLRMLEALNFNIELYHLNEGHCAFLTLELLRQNAFRTETLTGEEIPYDLRRVRHMCNFTTHTPVEAGHDRFGYSLVDEVLGEFIHPSVLRRLAGEDALNTTRLALNTSEFVNGVAKSHTQTVRRLYPGYQLAAITNGIHPATWLHPSFARLYDERLNGWRLEPELLMRVDCCLSGDEIEACHEEAKRELLAFVNEQCTEKFSPELPVIGYARRITAYKRPELLFHDIERLRAINARYPVQIVLAGKAHPQDDEGRHAIECLHEYIRRLSGDISAVFLPNYNMELAKLMVAGLDVWINTPQPPLEASGTSGMKAALNGVPNLSVLDGWWLEGHIEGITGWSIGNAGAMSAPNADAESLYRKLEDVVLPLYGDRRGWIEIMKGAIARNGSMFHSHRMMRRYAAEAYLT